MRHIGITHPVESVDIETTNSKQMRLIERPANRSVATMTSMLYYHDGDALFIFKVIPECNDIAQRASPELRMGVSGTHV